MADGINRRGEVIALSIAQNATESPVVAYDEYSALALHAAGGMVGATVAIHASAPTGTFSTIGISLTLAAGWNSLSQDQLATLFPHMQIKFVFSAPAGSAGVLSVSLKA